MVGFSRRGCFTRHQSSTNATVCHYRNATQLMVNAHFAKPNQLGKTIEQNALMEDHSHTIFDRMIAVHNRYIRVDRGGALTMYSFIQSLNSMPNSEVVWLPRTLDFKAWALPHCWAGLEGHTKPLHFRFRPDGQVEYKMNCTDDVFEPIGDLWTGEPDQRGPPSAPLYENVSIGAGCTPEDIAGARAKALIRAHRLEQNERSAADSVRKYITKCTAGELRQFGYRNARDAIRHHEWYVRQIPSANHDALENSHDLDLSWPPPYLVRLRAVRGDAPVPRVAMSPPSAPCPRTKTVHRVGTSSKSRESDAVVKEPSQLEVGRHFLYFHEDEPKLHLCVVDEIEDTGMEPARAELFCDSPQHDVEVSVSCVDLQTPPADGSAAALAELSPATAHSSIPDWLKGKWIPSGMTLTLLSFQLGPTVELTQKGTLRVASQHAFTAALRQVFSA